jgi:membrane associated rhomboid family serine protease
MPFEPFSFRTQPPAVKALLAVHTGVCLSQWFFWEPVTSLLGLTPARVLGSLWLWQPFTYIFLHTIGVLGFFFFMIDMYILSTLGRDLERRWGSGAFLFYYVSCGLAGAAATVALGRFSAGTVLGSSTVLLGLLTAFATLAPQAEIIFYFMPMTARQLLLLVVALEVLLAAARMAPLVEVAGHLTGMAAGFGLVRSRWLDRDWGDAWRAWRERRDFSRRRLRVVNMEQEVDRILDKVLKKGAGSLTRQEQEMMQRYSKSKK